MPSNTVKPTTISRRMREVVAALRQVEERFIDRLVESQIRMSRLQSHLAVVADHLRRVLSENDTLRAKVRVLEARVSFMSGEPEGGSKRVG